MNLLVLDFETFDPYLGARDLGPGWTYALNVPTSDFRVLGYSYCWINSINGQLLKPIKGSYCIITQESISHLKQILSITSGVVMHNSPYDLGCLLVLGIDISNIKVYDTLVISKLYDNRLFKHDLESLSKKYLNKDEQKDNQALIEIMEEHRLGPLSKLDNQEKHCVRDYDVMFEAKRKQKTYIQSMLRWAKQNMGVLQNKNFEKFSHYACQDVIATGELFLKFTKTEISLEQAAYWSSIQKIVVKLKKKGVKVDLDVIRKAIPELDDEIEGCFRDIKRDFLDVVCLTDKMLNSPKQLSEILLLKGYKLPKAAAGGDSTSSKWLEQQDDPLLNKIVEYRTLKKLRNDFFQKVLDMQQYTCPEGMLERSGRVYPSYNLFGATTGRFSCSSPNLQNIPKRNAKWGPIARSMFVPDSPDKNWISVDWSNQEGRLQVHYAMGVNADKAAWMVNKFKENPNLDLHQTVADLSNITRNHAKTVNLGLSYGMGQEKLLKSLGVTAAAGKIILEKYHAALPYLKELTKIAQDRLKMTGFVTTLMGRKLRRETLTDKEGKSFTVDYKAINKIMQGSGADMMYVALLEADRWGLDIKCIVHDEFNIEGTIIDVWALKDIMENSLPVKLHVPMVVEVSTGKTWGSLTKLKKEEVKE